MKRSVTLTLSILFALACVLSACGGSGGAATTTAATTAAATTAAATTAAATTAAATTEAATEAPKDDSGASYFSETVIEPTIMYRCGSYLYTGDELIFQAIAEKTNIKFKPICVPTASYVEKFNATIASGDIPDMINVVGMANVDMYGPQGAFVDLTPYLDKGELPNIDEVLNRTDSMKYSKSPDGHLYAVPRVYDMDFLLDENYVIRTDVLEKNDIAVPTTWDELYDAMMKLKDIYPDSTPITNRWEEGHILEGMTNVRDAMDKFYLNHGNGKVEYGPMKQGYKDSLEFLAKCFKDGVLDPEFVTQTDEAWEDKHATGRAFWAFDYASSFDGRMKDAALEVDPDWHYEPWLHPKYNGVMYGTICLQGYYGNYRAIAAKSKFAEPLVKFLEWTFSDDGVEVVSFGIEGDTYTKSADGTIKLADDVKTGNNPEGTREYLGIHDGSSFCNRQTAAGRDIFDVSGYLATASTEMAKRENSYGKSYFWYKFADEENNDRYNEIRTQLQTYMYEMSVKVITGQMDLGEWDTVVIPQFEQMGVNEALELINAANDALQ